MSEFLFIRIPPDHSDLLTWIVTDENGRRIGVMHEGSLAEAAEKAAQRRLVLIVPGTEVVQTKVQIPARGAARVRQAVPYALEDQLADDVENLHFAIGKRTDDDHYPVSVTARQNMVNWMQRLEAVGLRPQQVVADSACVPETPGGFTIIIDGSMSLVHGPEDLNLAVENLPLDQLLEIAGVHVGEESSQSLLINLYMTREDHEEQSELINLLSRQLPDMNTRIMVDGALAHLAAGSFSRAPTNLRQGDFAPRTSPAKIWKPWRLVAGLAAAVLLVAIAGQTFQLFLLKRQEQALDEQIQVAFKEVFPNVTLRGDPAAQMRSELAAMRAAAGGADPVFLEALSTLAAATSGQGGGRIDSISFRNGVMSLKLLVPSVEALDRIRRSMEQSGNFEVELESANPSGNQVEGRIEMRRARA